MMFAEYSFEMLAGVVVSLLFSFVPGFKEWFGKLTSEKKQLFMLGLLAVVVAARFGLSCAGRDQTFICSWDGAWMALEAFVAAVIANQGTYKATNYIAR